MALYWSKDDIPAMKALTPEQRKTAEKSVWLRVYAHWQVWLPISLWIAAICVYVYFVPDDYPYRKPLLFAWSLLIGKLLGPIFNYYLQIHLVDYKPFADPST